MTACPIRYQRQVPDRKGKIFYTSITSLSHISKKAPLPAIIISDHSGNTLNEESYAKLPKLKCISVSCPYDGKAVVQRNGKTEYVYKLSGEEHMFQ